MSQSPITAKQRGPKQRAIGASAPLAKSLAPGTGSRRRPGTASPLQAFLDRCLLWREQAKAWLASNQGLAYGVSLGFHLTLLVLASLLIIQGISHGEGQGEGDGLFGQMAGAGEELVLFDSVDTRLEGPGGGMAEMELPPLEAAVPDAAAINPSATVMPPPGLLADANGDNANAPKLDLPFGDAGRAAGLIGPGGNGKGGGGGGGGLPFQMPGGGRAVSKGSFTVWTVPEDPEPYQDYLIIIQVKLPKRTRQYERDDLSGMVIGTDRYQQTLPGFGFPRGRFLPVKDDVAQLAIPVPGAERLVRDTITVQSKLLKEKQTLEIVF